MFKIVPVHDQDQLDTVRNLMQEYVDGLGFELNFQDFQKEF